MEAINWQVVTGCERLTPGCDNCPTYWNFKKLGLDYHPQTHSEALRDPLANKVSSLYLVAAGSDLFHEAVRTEFILEVFRVMHLAYWHRFEVGTKRIERAATLSDRHLIWKENMTVFTGVESAEYRWRIDVLRKIEARRMLMFGPMVGRVGEVDLSGIEAASVIVEDFGPKPRPIPQEWVGELEKQIVGQGLKLLTDKWIAPSVSREINNATA